MTYQSLVICPDHKTASEWLIKDAPMGASIFSSRLRYKTHNRDVQYATANNLDEAYRQSGREFRDIEYRSEVSGEVRQYLDSMVRSTTRDRIRI